MDYRILGPLEVHDGREPIDAGSPQQRALLAILLLRANRVVSTERILEDLWPDDPTGKERTLWVYISRLRAILEPGRESRGENTVLVTRDHGYSLIVEPNEIDARRFEAVADEGATLVADDPAAAADTLREALGLWRGAALEDFVYQDFARADAERLEERRVVAIEDRIEADIRTGHHREVLAELEQLVADHPHREGFVAKRMVALYRSGRQADALRTFESHRLRIGEDLGIEPSPELRRIEEQVLLHDPRLSPTTVGPTTSVVHGNPFKGLQSFSEADSDWFFGRDRLVSDLVRRIADGGNLLALVGASGSGKSSVLHAGLIPAIRKESVAGSEPWTIAVMVPGARPFQQVEAALLRSRLDAPESLGELLDDPENGLIRACKRMLSEPAGRLLLVIDQFEELFTLAGREEAARFVHNIEVVLGDPQRHVVIALGLRADFYGMPLEFPVFARMLAAGIANVVPLTPDELEAAAEGPALRAGVAIEPSLMVRLLGDVAGQAGGLPVFQFALTELFDRREGIVLTTKAYVEMGGVSGAIAQRAEDLFLALDEGQRSATEQLFLRLVTIVDQGTWSRRRLSAAEIASLAADLVDLQEVLNRYSTHRLLTFDRDPVSSSPTVEVAHEALLNEWPRLRRWVDEGKRDVIVRERFATALGEWESSGRQAGYLLTGQRLVDYEEWASVSTIRLSAPEQRFLDASIVQRESALFAEQERADRELRLTRSATRRLWGLGVGGLSVLGVLAGGLVFLAFFAGNEPPAIAVVHGAADDLGINDLIIAGVGDVERELDLEVELVRPLVDAEEVLHSLASSGTDLVVVGREFDLAVERVAPEYPDVHWVAIDAAAVHIELPNVSEMHFDVSHSAFLAGAAAALSTDSGKVAFVGGYQLFRSERSRTGFEQGVAWANPDVEVVAKYLGPVRNPVIEAEASDDLAHDLALGMYADGVDVIFHDAGLAGLGVTRAATEWSRTEAPVWTIGSDVDEYLTLPIVDRDVVLTSTIKRFDSAVEAAISSFLEGDLTAGDTTLGLAEDGVALSRAGEHLEAIDGRLQNLEGDLELGHIDVSRHSASAPGWQFEPALTIELSLTDEECTVDRVVGGVLDGDQILLERDAVFAVVLTNASSRIAGLAVRTVPVGTTIDDLLEEGLVQQGPPASLGLIHSLTSAQLGARTGTSSVISNLPLVVNCIHGDLDFEASDNFPVMVIPT